MAKSKIQNIADISWRRASEIKIIVNPKQLSFLFGFKDQSWIHKLVKEKGYPKPADGKYSLVAWIRHRDQQHKEQVRNIRAQSLPETEKRMAEVELEDAELDLAKKKGELISIPEWLRVIDRIIVAVKRRMESQGNRLAPELLNLRLLSHAKKILDTDNEETLSELSNGAYVPAAPEPSRPPRPVRPDRKDIRANAESKRKRVGRQLSPPE